MRGIGWKTFSIVFFGGTGVSIESEITNVCGGYPKHRQPAPTGNSEKVLQLPHRQEQCGHRIGNGPPVLKFRQERRHGQQRPQQLQTHEPGHHGEVTYMGYFDSMNISATALTAQRLRMEIISENIANVNTITFV
jgi:hypothetical protein